VNTLKYSTRAVIEEIEIPQSDITLKASINDDFVLLQVYKETPYIS